MANTALALQYPTEHRSAHVSVADSASAETRFRAVFETHANYVWHTLRRLGIYEADLEDVTHEVFLAVFRHFAEFDTSRSIKAWLFGFTLRYAMRYRARARFHYERSLLDIEPIDESAGPLEQLEASEARALVVDALQAIPVERRAVFVMAEIDELSIPEISATLGVPLNTCYSRLRRARRDFHRAVRQRASSFR